MDLSMADAPHDESSALRHALVDTLVREGHRHSAGHSILRPRLAVHRTLSRGRLALLAIWHKHRISTRGAHKGRSPLQLSGSANAPTDWLVALGYPPAGTPLSVAPPPQRPARRRLAA